MNGLRGVSTSSTSQWPSAQEVTANVTKLGLWSLGVIDESGQPVIMEHQPVWRDVARVQGELLRWLLAPATPTA